MRIGKIGTGILVLSLAGLMAGCSPGSVLSSAPTAQLFDRDGTDILSEPASRNTSFFKDKSSTERVCRVPAPDFASTASQGFSVGLGLPGTGTKDIGEDAGKGALGLGGRDPEVLIVRELMYRACELSLNLNADQKTTLRIYDRFLRIVEKLGVSQTGKGVASTSAAAPAVQAPNVSTGNSDNSNSSSSDSSDSSDSSGTSSGTDDGF